MSIFSLLQNNNNLRVYQLLGHYDIHNDNAQIWIASGEKSCFIQETGPRLNNNNVQDLPQDPDVIPNTWYEVIDYIIIIIINL